MKKLSMDKLISTVQARREALGMTKKDLAEKCGMNRTMISHMENHNYVPSINSCRIWRRRWSSTRRMFLRRSMGLM